MDVGFWTDKGACDDTAAAFLVKLQGKEVFLFGAAGFGGEAAYFEKILKNTLHKLNSSNTIVCTHMCQGKMPMSVRERYEKMLSAPIHAPNLEGMIENFDKAFSHPDETDLIELKNAASK